ncbi:MAG TPA: GGDEF domain-containing protein [Thermodesulfobacteriota bacterium]|nr:GGDEF domain-containing protein [Thermodesulfobacteriota bacterium]
MKDENIKLYSMLSRLPFPRSYVGKIMLVAFLGIHLPLLSLIFYFVISSYVNLMFTFYTLSVAVLATLLGTAVTLYLLYHILAPVNLTSTMLRQYVSEKKKPDLPTSFTDEAGKLMADVQYTVNHLDEVISSLERTTMTDYLTGVYNRYACEMRLGEDIARVSRAGETASLVMLDIDDFKAINDKYGHDRGDVCLKKIVEMIKNNIRQGDWIARWGGDEFMIMLFNSDEASTVKIIERVESALKEAPNSLLLNGIKLTLSAGICQYNGQDDAEVFFRKVDSALLLAKKRGKGQVVCYSDISKSNLQTGST